jgi:hypothetical protein
MGLMQLMPGTARDLGVLNAYDPEENIRGGSKLLGQHLRRYRGDLKLTLAAYNAGPRRADDGSWVNIRETRNYVSKILGIYQGTGQTQEQLVVPEATIVVTPAIPARPKTNYLDLMFNAIYANASPEQQAELIENSGLDKVAESLLQDQLNGKLDMANLTEAAKQAASAVGVNGTIEAAIFLTPDEEGFKRSWLHRTGGSSKLLGLAHGLKSKTHVWVVILG